MLRRLKETLTDDRKLALGKLVSTGPPLYFAAGSLWKRARLDEHNGEYMEVMVLRHRRANGGSQFVDGQSGRLTFHLLDDDDGFFTGFLDGKRRRSTYTE